MKSIVRLAVAGLMLYCGPQIIDRAYAGEGHDKGYEWAVQHDIQDTGYSNGNSESFNEGVRQYAEEQAEAAREDGEGSDE